MSNLLQDIYLIKRGSCGQYQEVPASQFNFFVGDALGTTVLGQLNTGYSAGVSILGGRSNYASGQYSVVGGGTNNCVFSEFGQSFLGGGGGNTIRSDCATLVGGLGNFINRNAHGGIILGGTSNHVSGLGSEIGGTYIGGGGTIIGGCVSCAFNGGLVVNSVLSTARGGSTILGGYIAQASGRSNVILGGSQMLIGTNSDCVTILNGEQIRALKTRYSIIGGGLVNCIENSFLSTLVVGYYNCLIGGNNSYIGNGSYNVIFGSGGWDDSLGLNNPAFQTIWRNIDFPETGTTRKFWDYQITDGHFSNVNNGWGNRASAAMSTIHNGYNNCLSGSFYSTILNGVSNTVGGFYSTVLNGRENFVAANAHYSLAGGRKSRVLASHSGAMILSDSTDRFKDSVAANTLTLDFSNGIWFKSNINPESIPDSLIRASGTFV